MISLGDLLKYKQLALTLSTAEITTFGCCYVFPFPTSLAQWLCDLWEHHLIAVCLISQLACTCGSCPTFPLRDDEDEDEDDDDIVSSALQHVLTLFSPRLPGLSCLMALHFKNHFISVMHQTRRADELVFVALAD